MRYVVNDFSTRRKATRDCLVISGETVSLEVFGLRLVNREVFGVRLVTRLRIETRLRLESRFGLVTR